MLNQNCPRPEHTKSCNLLCPGVWATDPLNRKQLDIILERQEIRKIYFFNLFFIICFFPVTNPNLI